MSGTVLGAVATAAVLGATHAVEPDHVAGISSLTSRYGDARVSALAGACFSLGHVALVVLWLSVGYLLLDRTSFPAVFESAGTVGVAVLLGVLGVVTVGSGIRSLTLGSGYSLLGDRDDASDGHFHVHRRLGGHTHPHDGDDHDHDLRTYLRTGLVGALFTLSPPMSMLLFASTLFPTHGGDVVALSVVAYATAITGTMSLVGAGVGTLFGVVSVDARTAGIVRTLAGLLVSGLSVWILFDLL